MKISILAVGKTSDNLVQEAVEKYAKRLTKYINVDFKFLPDLKKAANLSETEVCKQEGQLIIKHLAGASYVVLLDEKGKEFSSVGFAEFLQKKMNAGEKHLVFIIGGAYGFSDEVKQKADFQISLSKMTFTHQMVRAIFAEQVYRAFSIINNEPYHHE
ncbi:MAG: 23S rRNA (pseudouridine(1915)-N(3))-methyltransferase RlmH [Bacteroidales bacterium]|nr:23S rRNA (pseudouridine(1915)-N(3))-methyltransferase RlmH [Bacteroidales bacterium]